MLRPALPGYDPATAAPDYSLEAPAEALRAERAPAGVSPGGLVGHSLGGYVALAFAEQYPGLVAGLGLFHSSALPDNEEAEQRRARNRTFLAEHGVAAYAEEYLQPQLSPTHRELLTNEVQQLQELAVAVPLAVAPGNTPPPTAPPLSCSRLACKGLGAGRIWAGLGALRTAAHRGALLGLGQGRIIDRLNFVLVLVGDGLLHVLLGGHVPQHVLGQDNADLADAGLKSPQVPVRG
ncbi:alpha/beta fold hydrolase [Hymenobacter sp. HD11105]